MKRGYYDDPLAAAWMQKHFNMEIYTVAKWCTHGLVVTIEEALMINGGGIEGCKPTGDKWYIHPDSMKLLEPQVGDWCYGELFGDGNPFFNGPRLFPWENNDFVEENKNFKIIHRNGLAFHWPKFEDQLHAR